jgi:hypothetical protein
VNVAEAIARAKTWVETEASRMPGFRGAHLLGGVNELPADAPFPRHRDVDLHVVLEQQPWRENLELLYEGVLLEVAFTDPSLYASADAILINPALACNLAVKSVLADPSRLFQDVQPRVEREYALPRWVAARCEWSKKAARDHLQRLADANSTRDVLFHSTFLAFSLSELIAGACLRPPTTRRSLTRLGTLLDEHDRPELLEELLRALGCAHLSREQVEERLRECAEAFDRAVEVHRTPIPFGYKLHPHVRPYLVEGARELVDEGHPREAMPWIWSFHGIAHTALEKDVPEAERPHFEAGFARLLGELHLGSPSGWRARFERFEPLVAETFELADSIRRRRDWSEPGEPPRVTPRSPP